MSTTETTTPASRTKQVSDRLNEIAAYPERAEQVTAKGLARYLAMRGQVIWTQEMGTGTMSRRQADLMTVLFGAAHALAALDESGREAADQAAREIWSAWEDGQMVGEWLWHHLGDETCSGIAPLAEELAALRKPADGLLAHADTLSRALSRAAVDARSGGDQDAYLKAMTALEDELDRARESAP